jgi:hypothetical protein
MPKMNLNFPMPNDLISKVEAGGDTFGIDLSASQAMAQDIISLHIYVQKVEERMMFWRTKARKHRAALRHIAENSKDCEHCSASLFAEEELKEETHEPMASFTQGR